jgi:hypothetical protein
VLFLLDQLPAADRAASDPSSGFLKQLLLAVCSNRRGLCSNLDLVRPLLKHPSTASLTAGAVANVAVAFIISELSTMAGQLQVP